jgi:hypothetical protein
MTAISGDSISDHYGLCLVKSKEEVREFFVRTETVEQNDVTPIKAFAQGESLSALVDLAKKVLKSVDQSSMLHLGAQVSFQNPSAPKIPNSAKNAETAFKKEVATAIASRIEEAAFSKVSYYTETRLGRIIFTVLKAFGCVSELGLTPTVLNAHAFVEEMKIEYKLDNK